MMKRVISFAVALGISIAIHFLALSFIETASSPQIQVKQPAANEIAAISAFQKLDEFQKSKELIDATASALASNLPVIETPQIDVVEPIGIPEKPPERVVVEKPVAKSNVKPSVTKRNTQPTQTKPIKTEQSKPQQPVQAKPNLEAQSKQAYNTFQLSVRNALFKTLRAPKGVQAAKVVVLVRFNNGRFSSASIEASSGNRELEKAVLLAAKRARYGTPPSGFSQSQQSYRITINIK